MIEAAAFTSAARNRGIGFYTGVPCSYLKPFINHAIDAPELRYVGAANEGDAVAIAAGAWLAGRLGVVMFQNSGLGNAVNPLTSLSHSFRAPALLIPTLRGEPGGAPDEPQHELMGEITTPMLEMLRIPWEYFPTAVEEIEPALDRAMRRMAEGVSYALVMRKGSVAMNELATQPVECAPVEFRGELASASVTRSEILRAVQEVTEPSSGTAVIGTTGYTGRELYACGDRANQIYLVGSMGCAVSLGLGIALAQPERKVVVLDGDGAALMRLGAQSIVGYERPSNLVHVLLDNAVHESTGGQATVARSVNFCAIAAACGYGKVSSLSDPSGVAMAISRAGTSGEGAEFIHVPIVPGVPDKLPRPTVTPIEVAQRLRKFLAI